MLNWEPPVIIAEIGCNHQGSMERAKHLIDLAKLSGCDVVKFQKRDIETMYPEETGKRHPVERHSFGSTYRNHRINLELEMCQQQELAVYCQMIGIKYACSAYDVNSFKQIKNMDYCEYIKIPSSKCMDKDLHTCIESAKGKSIHISLGCTTKEERQLVNLRTDCPIGGHLYYYNCVSCYPVQPDDMHIYNHDDNGTYGYLGYSGHHDNVDAYVLSAVYGYEYIEFHFTDDQHAKGTDNSFAMTPEKVIELKRRLNDCARMVKPRPDGVLDCELSHKNKVKT